MPVNYTLSYEPIKFTGGDIAVRGLGIPEISQIVSVNTEAAVTLFAEIQQAVSEGKELDLANLLYSILTRFQAAVAHTIALAADEPEKVPLIAQLPVDVQVAALEVIARRSFAMDGGAKKFWQTVVSLVGANDGLQKQVRQLSAMFTSGSGPSEANSAS